MRHPPFHPAAPRARQDFSLVPARACILRWLSPRGCRFSHREFRTCDIMGQLHRPFTAVRLSLRDTMDQTVRLAALFRRKIFCILSTGRSLGCDQDCSSRVPELVNYPPDRRQVVQARFRRRCVFRVVRDHPQHMTAKTEPICGPASVRGVITVSIKTVVDIIRVLPQSGFRIRRPGPAKDSAGVRSRIESHRFRLRRPNASSHWRRLTAALAEALAASSIEPCGQEEDGNSNLIRAL